MSSVPSMNAYVACHACHRETDQSHHSLPAPTGPGDVNQEYTHRPLTTTNADEKHVQQGGLLKQVFDQVWHPVTTTNKAEGSLNTPLLARITLRIRSFSGGSDSSEK